MELNDRLHQEKAEELLLSPYACLSKNTKGRQRPEEPSGSRTEFVRDRDRILHCKSFRRLKHKTQVFISPEGDHYRTRLTHTLEVSQIGRAIARSLRLNEDLTEAIALGHDLGHTPFGHAGEAVLREYYPGFTHFAQSLRVVEILENGHKGLNLTEEVRDGIYCHTNLQAKTLEGRIVRIADRIAYINHDIDDAVRGKVISEESIDRQIRELLGSTHSKRIDSMVRAVVMGSLGKEDITMLPEYKEAADRLHEFMFQNVYLNPKAKSEEGKAKVLVAELFEYFLKHPDHLPKEFQDYLQEEGLERVVCDYVAGMTDNYAISKFEEIYVPQNWRKS